MHNKENTPRVLLSRVFLTLSKEQHGTYMTADLDLIFLLEDLLPIWLHA